MIVVLALLVAGARAVPVDPFGAGNPGRVDVGARELAGEADRRLAVVSLVLERSEGSTLAFNNGRVFWGARIVAVDAGWVVVSHEGGVSAVPIESAAPDILARAQEDMAAALVQRRRWEEESAAREVERVRAAAVAAERALAAVLATEPGAERSEAGPAEAQDPLLTPGPVQRLAALKKKFPMKTKGRTDRGIEFDLPAADVWLFYRRLFEAATVETLPETLAYMESRRTQNLEIWQWRARSTAGLPQSREHLQAAGTQAWLERTLRAFLADARLAVRER